jgi:O-antigen ligase
MSEARTAGLALVLGVVASVLVSSSLSGIPIRKLLPGLASRRLLSLALMSVIGVVLAAPVLSDRISTYLLKRSGSTSLVEAADASRGEFVDTMIENIEQHPLTGIGFGIASDPSTMRIDRDPLLGLPTGAAIEKGVLPFAVIEELGIIGALLVLAWLWMLVRRGARSGVFALSVLTIVLLTNFGEATLFSPGGMGLLPLILLTWAVTGKHHYLRRRARV